MPMQRFQHTVQVPEAIELAWRKHAKANAGLSFNAFVLSLMAAALKVKPILITIFLLTLAVPAWAEMPKDGNMKVTIQSSGGCMSGPYECDRAEFEEAVKKVVRKIQPDPCLAKMEAAMKAIDHWIAWNPAQVDAIKLAIEGENKWAVDLLGTNKDRIVAIHQWETVKRECWTQKALPR